MDIGNGSLRRIGSRSQDNFGFRLVRRDCDRSGGHAFREIGERQDRVAFQCGVASNRDLHRDGRSGSELISDGSGRDGQRRGQFQGDAGDRLSDGVVALLDRADQHGGEVAQCGFVGRLEGDLDLVRGFSDRLHFDGDVRGQAALRHFGSDGKVDDFIEARFAIDDQLHVRLQALTKDDFRWLSPEPNRRLRADSQRDLLIQILRSPSDISRCRLQRAFRARDDLQVSLADFRRADNLHGNGFARSRFRRTANGQHDRVDARSHDSRQARHTFGQAGRRDQDRAGVVGSRRGDGDVRGRERADVDRVCCRREIEASDGRLSFDAIRERTAAATM